MKYIFPITLAMTLMAAPVAMAGFLDEGTRTIRTDLTFDDEMGDDEGYGVEVGFGGGLVALDDAGVFVGFRDSDDYELKSAGAYIEEHYVNSTPLIPFLGLGVGFSWLEADDGVGVNDEDSVFVRIQTGVKVLITDNMAISGQVLFSWADNDIYIEDGNEPDDTNIEGSIGLRFYY